MVASGTGIGMISFPTKATLLGGESSSNFLPVNGANLFENSRMSSWNGIFSAVRFSLELPTCTYPLHSINRGLLCYLMQHIEG